MSATVPRSLNLTLPLFPASGATIDFHEFDAAVRENYAKPEDFAAAHESYEKAQKLTDAGVELLGACSYLREACDVDKAVEFERTTQIGLIGFDVLLTCPNLIPPPLRPFSHWKKRHANASPQA